MTTSNPMSRVLLMLSLLMGLGCQRSLVLFPSDAGVACGTGTTACNGSCVILKEDPNHCGVCGRACAASEACAASTCYATTCADSACSAAQICRDEHCRERACVGVMCSAGQACFEGRCWSQVCGNGTPCPSGQVCVNQTCLDPSCAGVNCPSGKSCIDGQCIVSGCLAGTTCAPTANVCHVGTVTCSLAGYDCVDQNVNVQNGTVCADAGVCNAGTCVNCESNVDCTVANPCRVGRTTCASGSQSCTDTTVPQPNGLACGAGNVCNGGACTACVNDAGCQPVAAPCRAGSTNCAAAGGPFCTDLGTNQPPGTGCGVDQVCNPGGTCVACRAGVACAVVGAPCKDGATQCSTGASVCVEASNKPAGTACPGGVCDSSGACTPCSPGAVCTPSQCTQGSVSCGVGGATCGNVSNVAAGSACTGGVCVGPTCVACVAATSCTGNPNQAGCRLGTTVCGPSGNTCSDGAAKPASTSCVAGTISGLCNAAGVCITCTVGPCTSNPNSACRDGVIDCTSGSAVCTDGAPKGAGTACTGGVCNGSGTCAACTAGAACSSNPGAPCRTGSVSCGTGVAVCNDTGNAGPGGSCGTNVVCSGAGTCVACSAGQACSTNPNPCRTGTIACTSGAPVCADTATNVADRTLCQGTRTCLSGVCSACVTAADCPATSNCIGGGCYAAPSSCAALNAAVPTAPSGSYLIVPSGLPATTVFCEMSTAGGGWMLFAQFTNTDSITVQLGSSNYGALTGLYSKATASLGSVSQVLGVHDTLSPTSRQWTFAAPQTVAVPATGVFRIALSGTGDDGCASMVMEWNDSGCWGGVKAGPGIGTTLSPTYGICASLGGWDYLASVRYFGRAAANGVCSPATHWNTPPTAGAAVGRQRWYLR